MLRLFFLLVVLTTTCDSNRRFLRQAAARVDDMPILKEDRGRSLNRQDFNLELAKSDQVDLATAKNMYDVLDINGDGEIDVEEMTCVHNVMRNMANALKNVQEIRSLKEALASVLAMTLSPTIDFPLKLSFRSVIRYILVFLELKTEC